LPPVDCRRVDAAVVRLAHRAALAALVQLRGGIVGRQRVVHYVLQLVALAHRAAVFVFDLFECRRVDAALVGLFYRAALGALVQLRGVAVG
jgi:hypothetical protein